MAYDLQREVLLHSLLLLLVVLAVPQHSAAAQSYDCTTQNEVPQAECEALVALYTATNGDDWNNSGGWLDAATPVGEWFGVDVADGSIYGLNLDRNQLTGSIPPELGNLTSLHYLWLMGNSLNGAVPGELGSLASLEWLDLGSNNLTGDIPPELGNITSLQRLDVGHNGLTDAIPAELGSLTNLAELRVNHNSLSGSIPPVFGELTNLEELSVSNNRLSGSIPRPLGNLTNLRSLRLYENDLSGSIPSELANLTNLESLVVDRNQLGGAIPSELSNLTALQILDVSRNSLEGPLPLTLAEPEIGLLLFYFNDTNLCELQDPDFQTWLSSIEVMASTGTTCSSTSVEPGDQALLPQEHRLLSTFPNPAAGQMTIRFEVGEPARVRLEIYDILGHRVRTLLDRQQNQGSYTVRWNGGDSSGRAVASGFYLVRLLAGGYTGTIEVLIMR